MEARNGLVHVAHTLWRPWSQVASIEMMMTLTRLISFLTLLVALSACADKAASDTHSLRGDAGTTSSQAQSANLRNHSEPTRLVPVTVPASEVLGSRHSSLMALSPEEAAWLDRHGYPTLSEMDALTTYDINALEVAMRDRRDPKAAALVGHRRLLDGDMDGAWAAFAAGANLGSLYARQEMALASTQRITGLPRESLAQADQGNLQVMVAQLEVAKLLGDHRAQDYIDRYAPTLDWKRYGRHVLTQTAEFMRQYGEGARARGERPMGPDPRPNADAWSQLQADPYSTVTVYRRDGTSP